jgi:membrane associated rhomboid family serine protease
MGIENRDYFRDSSGYSDGGGWGFGSVTPVCKYLLIANIVVFVGQIFLARPYNPDEIAAAIEEYQESYPEVPKEHVLEMLARERVDVVAEWLQLETVKVVRQGQIWRLLTCAFCHSRQSVLHIVFNMLFLFWFGKTLETMYGSREFLLFYLTAAVAASLAYVGLDLVTGEIAPAIGASGAVLAVVMLYAMHFPRERIFLFFVFPIEIRWLVLIYVIFDLHPVLLALAGEAYYDGVAHAAHLGGLAFGYVYWRWNLRLETYWERVRMPRFDRLVGARRHIRLFQPSSEGRQQRADAEVDRILAKIYDQGEGSLTDREREVLQQASERYKNRKHGVENGED